MNTQKTVLIVEDEKNIVDILRFNLQREGYRTLEAYDGESGLAQAVSANPDLILLDVMLPKMNGFDVCKSLRSQGSNVPVIILTAREEESDKVLGLEIGADDYITKPFSMRELIARVGANIRRTAMAAPAATAAASAMPVAGDLSINTDSHQVFRGGKAIDLTQREYELLTFLASHPNKVYSRIALMEQVWNYGYVGDDVRTVDVTVRRLRELGFRTAAMALSDDSVSIEDPVLETEERLAIVLGTEGDGLSERTIADCDYTVRIPMSHGVDSLNVAAASAVAFWQLGR